MKYFVRFFLAGWLLSGLSAVAVPGQIDPAFANLNLQSGPNTLLPLSDARVVVGFNNVSPIFNGTNVGSVLLLAADGTLDGSFAASDTNKYTINSIIRVTGGNMLVSGNFTSWAGTGRKTLVKLDSTGAVLAGFFGGVTAGVKVFTAEQPDGKIILASSSTSLTATNGATLPPVARLLADGTRDTNFFTTNIVFICYALDMVPDGSGRFFVGFLNISNAKFQLSRFNADGTLDGGFASATFDNAMSAVHALPSGGAVLSGSFTTLTNSFGSNAVPHLVRLNADGSRDGSLNFTDTRNPQTFAIQSDGKIIVPGNSFVAQDRFNVDGSPDVSWTRNSTLMNPTSLTIDSFDRALCGGFSAASVFRKQNDATFGPIAPFFSNAPPSASVYPGDSTNFTLSAGGPGPITYQWQFNSNNIAGATNTSLILTNCQLTNGGWYRLVAANANGSTPSTDALLSIRLEPRITQNPLPVSADASDTTTFSILYSSVSAAGFQWFFNSTPIPGATNNPLIITPVSTTNAGSYSVIVTNVYGAATSSPALLSVNSTLRIKTQPVTNLFVTAGVTTNIAVVAAGEPSLAYQWFMNGVPLTGATGSSLVFNPIDRTNSGTYYLVVTNNSGSVTSLVTRVAAFGAPVNAWVNTNALPSGTAIADLQSDGPLGVVLLGNNGISRIDDDGVLRWTIPFTPSNNIVTGGFGRLACAVDGLGNTFVTCPFTGVVNLGSLSATNPGVITVPNPNARGAFLAKLDITGQPVWMRYIDGGLDFTKVTVDGGGGVVITGAHNSVVNFGNGGNQATPNANGGALARYNPDGTLAWIRNYASTTGGLVEIDAVAAQGTNIWVGGIFNFNVKFGTFTATDNSVGHAYNSWFGALNTNGTELWLQSIILGSQFMHLGAGLDQSLWAANGSSSDFIVRIAPNGAFNGGGTPFSPTVASVGCINIDSNNVAVISGGFSSSLFIGTNSFTRPNTFTNFAYTGRFDTNGAGLGAVADGFSTTGSAFQFFAGNRRGDAYVAGAEPVVIGTNTFAGTNFYVAKLNVPALAPAIITQPNAGSTNLPFNRFDLNVTALGQAPLSYQWRNNGVPIPNQTNATLTFTYPLPPDGGSLDCVVSNAWGTITSSASQVAFLPPFNIVQQPASTEIILGTNEISGSNVLASFLQPTAMVGHQFNFFITNGVGVWPQTGNFALTLPTSSTFSIPTGTLGTHAGNLINPYNFPQGTGFSLLYWSTSPSNVMSSITMATDGSFGIHHDITDPAGCCAEGYYTIAGGSSNATFHLTLSGSVLPTIQWFQNGVALAGQTNSTLSFVPAGYPQVGTYTASLTYSNYVTTTAPATLSIYPPALGYTFVPGNSTMNFTVPPGYALQTTATLTPVNWATISVSATFNVPLNQPGAYFRIVPQ